MADLPGSFNAKKVKGRVYRYFQYTEPSGKLRQVYVGLDNEAVQRLMLRHREGPSAAQALGRSLGARPRPKFPRGPRGLSV